MRVGIHFGFTFLSFRAKSRNLLLFPETFRDVSSQLDIVSISRGRSISSNNFPESGNTPPTPLPHSLSISRWPLSRRILRAFYHVCSICEFRSIRLLDGTRFGTLPPLSLQKRPRPHIIQRFSILVR